MTSGSVIRSVSWLVSRIASKIDASPELRNVTVEAEILNFNQVRGHWYFSLKDDNCRIECAMWASDNYKVLFTPKSGDRVIVRGNVTVYKVQGKVQLTVYQMVPAGEGDLKAQFDALYRKLEEEGLFDPAHKKPLPLYPMHIALVTGNATHARADVYKTLGRRWPVAKITEFPAPVQGKTAPPEIIAALRKADRVNADVVLLCRGGGSMEDLWCFNDEDLARTIYDMKTPVVTGVGHEPDHTLVDYVADVRAPTPTGAAEQASPDIRKVRRDISDQAALLQELMRRRIETEQDRISAITSMSWYVKPESMIYSRRMQKDLTEERFLHLLHSSSTRISQRISEQRRLIELSVKEHLKDTHQHLADEKDGFVKAIDSAYTFRRDSLSKTAGLLDAYSPLKVLSRGYSVVAKEDMVITDATMLNEGDSITIRMHKGTIDASVTKISVEETK